MRAVTCLASCLIFGALPSQKSSASTPLTPELSLEVVTPSAPSVSPDGKWVVFEVRSRKDGTQLYLLSLEDADATPRRLTHAGTQNRGPVWSPDGRRVAFSSNRTKPSQICVLDMERGGEARALTALSTGASGPIWSPDGRWIAFRSRVNPSCKDDACNRKMRDAPPPKSAAKVYDDLLYRHWTQWDDGMRNHIFVVDAQGKTAPKDLTPGAIDAPSTTLNAGRGYTFWGSDRIVYAANLKANSATSTNNDLFAVTLSGAQRKLTKNPAWDAGPLGSPDGRYLAYRSFSRAGFEADQADLIVLDRKSGRRTNRTEKFDRSVRNLRWSPEGQLYFTAYERGRAQVYSLAPQKGAPQRVKGVVSADALAIGPEGQVVIARSSLVAPGELFVIEGGRARQLSHLNDAWRKKVQVGDATDMVAKSKDGTEVHGFIVTPPPKMRRARNKLLLLVHGGPQGAWRDRWGGRWNPQLFAARGYVVAMPNPRGSIGYGQAFVDAVTKNWGGGPFEDVMAFTEAAASRRDVQKNAVAAAGASYGGYMVNWIAGHTDRFSALISHAGVYNLESFWGDTEELWFPEWEFGGPPWKSRALYEKWSPHRYIHRATTPTLVIHGQLDYRVHLSQGQQMFSALRRRGVPARFLYFPDEGHWILKPANYRMWYSQMFRWLDEHLRPRSSGRPRSPGK